MYLIAFSMRLLNTCVSRIASPRTVGNAPTVPECTTQQTADNANLLVVQDSVQQFVAGSSALFPRGTSRFQCCFHPWMRTTITVR